MITKIEASSFKQRHRHPVWHGEGFAAAVVRLDKEIREASTSGVDGTSPVFNPAHVKALLVILHEHGFSDAKVNCRDDFRIDISW